MGLTSTCRRSTRVSSSQSSRTWRPPSPPRCHSHPTVSMLWFLPSGESKKLLFSCTLNEPPENHPAMNNRTPGKAYHKKLKFSFCLFTKSKFNKYLHVVIDSLNIIGPL